MKSHTQIRIRLTKSELINKEGDPESKPVRMGISPAKEGAHGEI